MSASSSLYSFDSDYPPRPGEHPARPDRSDSLPRQDARPPVMNLPNIVFSTEDAIDFSEQDQQQQSIDTPRLQPDPAEQQRYEALMHSMDMMEGTYKYAGLGLTRKIPGSVARGRALAESRLRNCRTQPSSLRVFYSSSNYDSATRSSQDTRMGSSSADTLVPLPVATIPQGRSEKPIGKWQCCKCGNGHEVYAFTNSLHPVSVLGCDCAHRSCSKCTLSGQLKQFVPMVEPEVVPLSEDDAKAIRFGVFCDGCGVSWRAEKAQNGSTAKEAVKSALLAIPKRLRRRDVQHSSPSSSSSPSPVRRLRASQSLDTLITSSTSAPSHLALPKTSKSVFNLRALAHEMQKEHGQQADVVSVRFSGIKCECGMVTDNASSLCFQIVDPPVDFYHVLFARLMAERKQGAVGFGSTDEDRKRGHQTEMLVLRGGIRHPNPLRSCPV